MSVLNNYQIRYWSWTCCIVRSPHQQRLNGVCCFKLNLLATQQAEYLISKLQCNFYEHEEKAGKLLVHQLLQKTVNQAIPEVCDEQGVKHTDNAEINSCFHRLYQSLYSSNQSTSPIALDDFLKKLDIPTIDPN